MGGQRSAPNTASNNAAGENIARRSRQADLWRFGVRLGYYVPSLDLN